MTVDDSQENEDGNDLETFHFKPDIVEFNLQEDKFTAITAADGQRKERDTGEAIEFSAEFFESIVDNTPQKPVVINHDLRMVIGGIRNSIVNDDGNLVQTFDVENSEAADRIRNDAFEGFSIGVPRDSLVFADDGETAVGGDFHHLSVSFFPNKPVCGKDECHVLFSENGLSRSCLCSEGAEKEDIVGLRFDQSLYNLEDAISWAEEHEVMCADDSERDALVRHGDDEIELFDPTLESLPDSTSEADMGPGVVAYFDEDDFIQAAPGDGDIDIEGFDEDDIDDIATKVAEKLRGDDNMTENDNDGNETDTPEEDTPEDEAPEEEAPEEQPSDEGEGEDVEQLKKELQELRQKEEQFNNVEEEKKKLSEQKKQLESQMKDNVIEDLPELDDSLRQIHDLSEDQNWKALDLDELRKEKQRLEVYGVLSNESEEGEGEEPEETSEGDDTGRQPAEGEPPEPPKNEEDPETTAAKDFYKEVAPYKGPNESSE